MFHTFCFLFADINNLPIFAVKFEKTGNWIELRYNIWPYFFRYLGIHGLSPLHNFSLVLHRCRNYKITLWKGFDKLLGNSNRPSCDVNHDRLKITLEIYTRLSRSVSLYYREILSRILGTECACLGGLREYRRCLWFPRTLASHWGTVSYWDKTWLSGAYQLLDRKNRKYDSVFIMF